MKTKDAQIGNYFRPTVLLMSKKKSRKLHYKQNITFSHA